MAVKASATVTLSSVVDVKSVWRYYLLQASTLSKPSKPTTNPPSGWTTTEPSYTSGSTNSLYFCDLTVFCDNTFVYSDVSLSSSYEAAKAAYNKAVAAQNAADSAQNQLDKKGLRETIIDLLNTDTYDTDTYYPVVGIAIPYDGYHTFEINNQLRSNTAPSWSTHGGKGFVCNLSARMIGDGWGIVNSNYGWIDNASYNWCDKMPAYIQQMKHSSYPVFYLRGGGKYYVYTDYACTWSIKTETYERYNESVAPTKTPSNFDKLVNNWYVVTRVTNAETDIKQSKEAIELCATKTEVTEVKNNLANNYSTTTQMNAAIKTSADSITSTVSKTYQVKGDYATNSALDAYDKKVYFTASGAGDTATYMQMCTIKVSSAYVNAPIIIGITDRAKLPTRIIINFGNTGGTDPSLAMFNRDGSTRAYMVKTDTSAWALYVTKSESYASIRVTEYENPHRNSVAVTWTGVNTASLPSGYIEATELIGSELKENYTTQTQMTQTSEEIRMDFTKSIASASSDLQSQMDANNTATNQKLSEINRYIRFVDGKIVLGETGNELMLTIQNDRVSFTQSGVEVAYFSNNNLYVKRAEVLTTMKIGNYEFTPRNDGGLALRKRSE